MKLSLTDPRSADGQWSSSQTAVGSLKGCNTIAQGNALGREASRKPKPCRGVITSCVERRYIALTGLPGSRRLATQGVALGSRIGALRARQEACRPGQSVTPV